MKKKTTLWSVLVILAIFAAAFSACNSARDRNSNEQWVYASVEDSPDANAEDSYVHYLRTDSSGTGAQYPIITVVSSTAELRQYYDKYKDSYNLSVPSSSNADPNMSFADAIKQYTTDFFANNFLVMVILAENSGSNRHKVETISETGAITITRILPEIGTTDMANWHIIIERKNAGKLGEFSVVMR